jgi:hypothetical protein
MNVSELCHIPLKQLWDDFSPSLNSTVEFFRQILSSKDTFCLVAKEQKSLIACTYGTHVSVDGAELFHLNLLGRRIEYPSLHLVKRISSRFVISF